MYQRIFPCEADIRARRQKQSHDSVAFVTSFVWYRGRVFSGQASTHELERALRDLDARLTRDFVSGDVVVVVCSSEASGM
jgi:hypothetical protein